MPTSRAALAVSPIGMMRSAVEPGGRTPVNPAATSSRRSIFWCRQKRQPRCGSGGSIASAGPRQRRRVRPPPIASSSRRSNGPKTPSARTARMSSVRAKTCAQLRPSHQRHMRLLGGSAARCALADLPDAAPRLGSGSCARAFDVTLTSTARREALRSARATRVRRQRRSSMPARAQAVGSCPP